MGLGTFRFFLAFLVAISHLWSNMIGGLAAYSVWGFYLISGYLMAYVLNSNYKFEISGLINFYKNRMIRIYPGYYFALLLGIIVLIICKNMDISFSVLNPEFGIPNNISSSLFNITLFPFFTATELFVPVSKALGLEVGFYLLAPLISKNKYIAISALIFSLANNFNLQITQDTFSQRYSGFDTALFAFSFGVTFFFYKEKLTWFRNKRLSIYIWIFQINTIAVNLIVPWTWGIYISLVCTLFVLNSFCDEFPTKTDSMLGDMSYIIYLIHTTIGYLILCFFPLLGLKSFLFFLVTFIITVVVAYFFTAKIERPIHKILRKMSKHNI